MPDLLTQLRAYGRQLEADIVFRPSRRPIIQIDPVPIDTRTSLAAADRPIDVRPADDSEGQVSGRPSPPSSRRPVWLLVAAATAAVAVAGSLLVSTARPEAADMSKGSGLALGACLLVAGCTSATQSSGTATRVSGETTTPTTAVSSMAAASTLREGAEVPVDAGTYVVDVLTVPIEITVPAGWTTSDEVVLNNPDGAGLAIQTGSWDVYTDACNWVDARADVGPTVDDLVTALVAQEPTTNTPPQERSAGGFSGTELTISAPSDLDIHTCYGGLYATLIDDLHRQAHLDPGSPRTFWILDLNGQRAIIQIWLGSQSSDATRAQLDAMVASMKFG